MEPPSLSVAVGSGNRVKVAAASSSFEAVFPGAAIVCMGFDCPSGVRDQPMGNDETRRGAMNRAIGAAAAFAAANGGALPHFAVGLEGGCGVETLDLPCFPAPAVQPSQPSYGAGAVPPVAATAPSRSLTCFAYMAVLQPSSGRWGLARTAEFSLPPAVALLVEQGVELGTADDQVFGRVDSKRSNGAVGLLTHDVITRAEYYRHALVQALIPFTPGSEAFYLAQER